MIKKRKICAIVLSALMLVVTIIPSVYANAADEFTITGSVANVKAGKEVSVDINLVNNPGISAINLYYTYNTNYLTLKNVENKVSKFTMTNDVTTVWDATSNYTEDGTLATLTFEVAENTPSGEYAIAIKFLDASNDSFQSVSAHTSAGTIIVEALPVAVTGLSLNKDNVSLVTGGSETLNATVNPDNATNKAVVWSSGDSTIATVDANGTVVALKKGTTTITAITEDGGFKDTCLVTVACGHSNTTTHPAVPSTCLVQGNNEYITCDDCNEVILGSDTKLPFGSHAGGTATCKDKAVCMVCNKPYGDYASCRLTNHPHNEADHSKSGNIEYWTCDVCNKYFSDATGKNEIGQEDTVIDKIPHSYDINWSYNTTQHWKECDCGAQTELTEHQFDNACDTTCNTGCGYTRTITHQWKTTYFTDNTKHWHECEICGEKKDEGRHSGGTASCKEQAVCEVCDKAYGELTRHNMIEQVDATYLRLEANCVAKAVYYKSCSVCSAVSTETFEAGAVNSANHTGAIETKNAVKETCTTDGYSGDVYCKDCGVKTKEGEVIPAGHNHGTTYKTDAEKHWKECSCGDIVEKGAHTFSKWAVIKDATTTEKGSRGRICSVCEYSETEEIPTIEKASPKTGDYNVLYMWLTFMAVSCLGVVETVMKKKR